MENYFDNEQYLVKFIQKNRKEEIFRFCKRICEELLDDAVIPHFVPWNC